MPDESPSTQNSSLHFVHSSQRARDIEEGRLLTLTGTGNARWFDTNAPISKTTSVQVVEAKPLRGASAALVIGLPVNGNGKPRRGAKPRQILVTEGSFIVWW